MLDLERALAQRCANRGREALGDRCPLAPGRGQSNSSVVDSEPEPVASNPASSHGEFIGSIDLIIPLGDGYGTASDDGVASPSSRLFSAGPSVPVSSKRRSDDRDVMPPARHWRTSFTAGARPPAAGLCDDGQPFDRSASWAVGSRSLSARDAAPL